MKNASTILQKFGLKFGASNTSKYNSSRKETCLHSVINFTRKSKRLICILDIQIIRVYSLSLSLSFSFSSEADARMD